MAGLAEHRVKHPAVATIIERARLLLSAVSG
jgi:hypothetical protein